MDKKFKDHRVNKNAPETSTPSVPVNRRSSNYHLGIFLSRKYGGKLLPCHRKDKSVSIELDKNQSKGMRENDIIVYKLKQKTEFHFVKNLGSIESCKIFSSMAAYAYGLEQNFKEESIKLADKAKIPPLDNRTDLREIPLVTIDGSDAKDFDDAVYAVADSDAKNLGGWKVIVAIADVSYYVQRNDALDEEAQKRGNSVYFADKVIPMLPEKLSNDLCSLRPNEDRACLAVEMTIRKDGKLKSFIFKRALMRSKARLTYEQVEEAIHGKTNETTNPLLESVIKPLYSCYKSLKKARMNRGTINVESAENSFTFNEDGSVKSISPKNRLESHQIIEELMITANVAAAKTLKAKDWPGVYRIHEQPNFLKLRSLEAVAKNFNVPIRKFSATNTTLVINELLDKVTGCDYSRMFNELVLRSQAQAKYSTHNIGHFGLNLAYYCHFTSPIRRYADLLVHRALIECLGFEKKTINICTNDELADICDHISKTERIAMEAEREVQDRFMADYLKNHLGDVFDGVIVGVGIPGLYVELNKIGAQGFIPKSSLPSDFYIFNEEKHSFFGSRTKKSYSLGDKIKVQVVNADPVTCSVGFSLNLEKKKLTERKKFSPSAKPYKGAADKFKGDKSASSSKEKNHRKNFKRKKS